MPRGFRVLVPFGRFVAAVSSPPTWIPKLSGDGDIAATTNRPTTGFHPGGAGKAVPRSMLVPVLLESLEDVLSADLRHVQKSGVAGNRLEFRRHQLRVRKRFPLEIHLNQRQLTRKSQRIVTDGILEGLNVEVNADDAFEDLRKVLGVPVGGVVEFGAVIFAAAI